jgi:hypothetical protein
MKDKNITREEFRRHMGSCLYFVNILPQYGVIRCYSDEMKSLCISLVKNLFLPVNNLITGENMDSTDRYGSNACREDLLWYYHEYVGWTAPMFYEIHPKHDEINSVGEDVILGRCSYLVEGGMGVVYKDYIGLLYRIFKVMHTNNIILPRGTIKEDVVPKNIGFLYLIFENEKSSPKSSILTKPLVEGMIDIVKIYTENSIFEDARVSPYHYISTLYRMLKDAKDDVLTHSSSILSLFELAKSSITYCLENGKECNELFKEFPYDKIISSIIATRSLKTLGTEKWDCIVKTTMDISKENQVFPNNISASLQKYVKILVDTEYDSGSGLNPKLYYDTSARFTNLFFGCGVNKAFTNMFDLLSGLLTVRFNEFFIELGCENLAKMIYSPILVTGVFHTKTIHDTNIIKYLNDSRESRMGEFCPRLFSLLEGSLNKIDNCGGKGMLKINSYVKEDKVDNNIIVITQEVGGVGKIVKFMNLLLWGEYKELRISFLKRIFQSKNSLPVLESAREIFYRANILLAEKPKMVWAFTYELTRRKKFEDLRNEKHLPTDLVGMAFMRGYTHLSELHLRILSYSSLVGEGNANKHKFGDFKNKFLDEIKSWINMYEDNRLRCMKLFILLLTFLDYMEVNSAKDLLKSLDKGLLEELRRKVTNGNSNVTLESLDEKYGHRSIEWTCFRLVERALKFKNSVTNVGTGGMEDTQPRETRCNRGGQGQHRRAAPPMNNLGASWRR